MAWQIFFFAKKKRLKRQIIDGKWTKNTTTFGRRPAETSAVAKKKKYDSHMKVDIIPLNPRILPVVLASTKTFSVGITKVIMKKLLVHRDLSFLS